jgi:hypothetical protein
MRDNILMQLNETNCENISSHSMPSMSLVRGTDIVQGGGECIEGEKRRRRRRRVREEKREEGEGKR